MNFIRDVILLEQKKILYDLVILSVDRQLFGIGTLTMKIRYNINQFRKMGYVVVNCNKVRHGKRFIVIVTLANKCCIFAKNPRKIKKTVNY